VKHLDLWRSVGLSIAVVLATGCAVNMRAGARIEERIVGPEPEPAQPQVEPVHTPAAPMPGSIGREKAPGVVVHIDPITGEFLPEPPAYSVATPQAAKAPEPQFFEVPSTVPGGGVVVELKGHFRTPLVATIETDGKVKLNHQSTLPSATDSE
jgi:hypothetical protein